MPTPNLPTPKLAETTSETASSVSNAVKETAAKVESAHVDTMKDAAAKFENATNETQKTMSEQMEKFTKGFEGVTTFGQENMDAMVKSSEIAAKAAEGIGSELSAYSKKSFEETVAAAQDLAAAKTVVELFEKQTAFAQTALESWMQQATKMNEIYVSAVKEITAPIGARMSAATDRMKSFAQ